MVLLENHVGPMRCHQQFSKSDVVLSDLRSQVLATSPLTIASDNPTTAMEQHIMKDEMYSIDYYIHVTISQWLMLIHRSTNWQLGDPLVVTNS